MLDTRSPWCLGFIVIPATIALFRIGIEVHSLAPQNPSGSPWAFDHAYLIVLLLVPVWWLQLFGMVCYLDDWYQHARIQQGDQHYESPLHRLAGRLRLYDLRDYLATKPGFRWLSKL